MTQEENKSTLANTIADFVNPYMSDCEKYGMMWGCDIDCPVLRTGKCELEDSENKELYQQFLSENTKS